MVRSLRSRRRRWVGLAGAVVLILVVTSGLILWYRSAGVNHEGRPGYVWSDGGTVGIVASPPLPAAARPAFDRPTIPVMATPFDQLVQQIGPAVRVRLTQAAPRTSVVFSVHPGDLPAAEKGHAQPTMQNVGLEQYNEVLGMWLPVETTVDATHGEARAALNKSGTYRLAVAKLGTYTLVAGRTLKLTSGVGATPYGLVRLVMTAAVRATLAAGLRDLEPTKYKCGSPSRTITVTVVSASGRIEACAVNAAGASEVRIRNGLPVPWAFRWSSSPGVHVAVNASNDMPEVSSQLAAVSAGTPFALAPGVAAVKIDAPASLPVRVTGQIDWTPVAVDMTTTLLSAFLPSGMRDAVPPYRSVLATLRTVSAGSASRELKDGLPGAARKLKADPVATHQAEQSLGALECTMRAVTTSGPHDWLEMTPILERVAARCTTEAVGITVTPSGMADVPELQELTKRTQVMLGGDQPVIQLEIRRS